MQKIKYNFKNSKFLSNTRNYIREPEILFILLTYLFY